MGGTADIWKKAGANLGLEIDIKRPLTDIECKIWILMSSARQKVETERKKFIECLGEQRFDDGKLEFFTYQNGMRIGLEKMFAGGNAQRVYHGKGPFIIKFKKMTKQVEFEFN